MMNILENKTIAVFFTFLIFSLSSVFANGSLASDDVIWQASPNVFFKYVDRGKSKFGKNDHPVELKPEEVVTILRSLKIEEKEKPASGEELVSLFSVQQAEMLGRNLAKGLRSAQPNQDIIFAMEKSVSRSFGLKPNRFFVAGRAFYKNNKLNIIMGDYDRRRDDAYEVAYDPTHVGILRYNFDHGSRSRSSKGFNRTLVTVNGVGNKQLNETRRDDWLVINVATASDTYDRMTTIHKKEETARKREELREILGSDETNRSSKGTRSLDSLEERLTTLNRLKAKGLITDEEYAEKRKQILDEL